MKVFVGICLMLMACGALLGWFFMGGISGSMLGLVLTGCIALPFYCIASVFKHNAAALAAGSVQDPPSFVNLDPSQLPRGAYDRDSDG